jgi:TonB family protein
VGARKSNGPVNAPAGISVASPPATPASVPDAPAKAEPADPNERAKFMAAMHPPLTSIPPRQPLAHESKGPRSELENRIFAGRRSYTLSVNMPNLNTATGSWIIHFVEREPNTAQSPVAAPEVVSKSDPAYPGELIQDGVQGTVILRAIIRADGSVGDISVVQSLNPRLDQNAMQALSRWLFRPALKNGQAIDLEAVITVPFRAHATSF